jgi:hypothetical protein
MILAAKRYPARWLFQVCGIALLFALLHGAAIEAVQHHDHNPLTADSHCAVCGIIGAASDTPPALGLDLAPLFANPRNVACPLPRATGQAPLSSQPPLRGPPIL